MWISDARIVLPDQVLERGSLRIVDGIIDEIVDGPAPQTHRVQRVDAHGLTAFPGIIDFHGDMLERDMEPRPSVYFPMDLAVYELDKRLAATGITTAYAAISFLEGNSGISVRTTDRAHEIVELVHELAPSLLVDLRVHVRFEVTNPKAAPVILRLIEQGKVQLVSLMDHTPGQGQYRNLDTYAEIIEKWRKISRDEAERMTEARVRRAQESGADWDAARQVADATRGRGLPVASHDDDSPEKVDQVIGLGATICEFPVTLEAAEAARARGMQIAMGAPNVMLGGSHTGNLSAREAIEAGLVDLLLADYYPAALLHSIYAIEHAGLLPLHQAANLVTRNPALALGLPDRGALVRGASADVVLVEDAGRPRVRGTIRQGVPIYWDAFLARSTARTALIESV